MAHRNDHAAALARADALARDLARERKRAAKAERKLAAMAAEAEARARREAAKPTVAAPPFQTPIENLADYTQTGVSFGAGIIVVLMLLSIAAIIAAVGYAIR